MSQHTPKVCPGHVLQHTQARVVNTGSCGNTQICVVIQFHEECLGDHELQNIGDKLRKQLLSLIYINKTLIPKYILEQRKSYRESIRIRNTYAETLNLLQADIMKKLKVTNLRNADKKLLMDAMMVTIAGISAAMKNTG